MAVIDPHGDLASQLLDQIPKNRQEDLISFDPSHLERPLGINLLDIAPGLSGVELDRQKDLVCETVVSVFRKVFSKDLDGGHRVEHILRNSIQTALCLERPTIFSLYRLLTDWRFLNEALKRVDQLDLKLFWQREFSRAGSYQQVKMAAGVTAKLGRYLFSQPARAVFGQSDSKLDFAKVVNQQKILICNLAKGKIGEDNSRLFGTTLLAKIQLAILARANLEISQRRDFYLYVDEFQNLATTSFVEMLSESRKYRLSLTIAEQSTQQQDQQLVATILANVGSLISFRTGALADAQAILPLLEPLVSQLDLMNLANFNFYARLGHQPPIPAISGFVSKPL